MSNPFSVFELQIEEQKNEVKELKKLLTRAADALESNQIATSTSCEVFTLITELRKGGRVTKEITEFGIWYWLEGKFYIISDAPSAEEKRKVHPEIEALPLAELERMTRALDRRTTKGDRGEDPGKESISSNEF